MRSRMGGTGDALRSPFPWIALIAALALTAAGWFGLEKSHYADARVRFERRSDTATAELRAHVIAYEQALRASAAHVAVTHQLTQADWRRYVGHLRLDERLPGFVSLGYAEVARRGGGEMGVDLAFNESARTRYAVPSGFDLTADPVRKRALEAARASGEAVATSRVTLPIDRPANGAGTVPGFLMFAPVYHELPDEMPLRERGKAIAGYMVGAFALDELVRASLGESLDVLDVRIYDEAEGESQPQLVDTRGAFKDGGEAIFQRVARQSAGQPPNKIWVRTGFSFGALHGVGVAVESHSDFSGHELYFREDQAALQRVLTASGLHVDRHGNIVEANKFVDGGHPVVSVSIHGIAGKAHPHFPAARSWLGCGAL